MMKLANQSSAHLILWLWMMRMMRLPRSNMYLRSSNKLEEKVEQKVSWQEPLGEVEGKFIITTLTLQRMN